MMRLRGFVLPALAACCHLGCAASGFAVDPPARPMPNSQPRPANFPAPGPAASLGAPMLAPVQGTTTQQSPVTLPLPQRLPGQVGNAPAEQAAAEPRALTLAELEQAALLNNPTIPAARALVMQQQGILRQAGLYPNPTAGYLRTDADQTGQSQTAGVFVSQDIVTPGKIRTAQASAANDVQWRDWQLKAQMDRVRNDVRIRYYEVLGAQEAVRLAAELERFAVEGVRATEKLLKANLRPRTDLLLAENQLSAARTALQDAKYRHQAAWQQLINVVGIPDLQPAPLAGSLEQDIPQLDWKQSLEQLLTRSPILLGQQALIRSAGYDVKLARLQAIPNVNVQVVAQRDHIMKYSSVSTLISLPVPIFNRNQGNIQNMMGLLQQQQKEYDRIQLALADQLAAAFLQYKTTRNQAERLKHEILPRAKEYLDLITRGFNAGQVEVLRLLDAQQKYREPSLAYIDALTAAHKSAIEITGLELVGGLNPTEVGTALQTQMGMGGVGARNVLLQQLQQQGPGATRVLPGAIQGGTR